MLAGGHRAAPAGRVRANRDFLGRAVRYLAGEAGIRQFLDLGTGIPNADNVHGVAQATAPDARVVYVDHDPVVLAHAHTLLSSTPEGADHVHLRRPARPRRRPAPGRARHSTSPSRSRW